MSSEALKTKLAAVEEESWLKSRWRHEIKHIVVCVNEILALQNPDPGQSPQATMYFFVTVYWKVEKAIAMMLRYFQIDVREKRIFCHGYRETYPTALDEVQKKSCPFHEFLGPPPIMNFLLRYRHLCDWYKSDYDHDVEHATLKFTVLQELVEVGSLWFEIRSNLSDITTCIKMDAAQCYEGMSTWERIRAYDFSLALKKNRLSHYPPEALATPIFECLNARVDKERSFMQNFGQSPQLYVRNISLAREHAAKKESTLQTKSLMLKGKIKALENDKVQLSKTLEEKEKTIRRIPDWVHQLAPKVGTVTWEKGGKEDGDAATPQTKQLQNSARALHRAFEKHASLLRGTNESHRAMKFVLADQTRKIYYNSVPVEAVAGQQDSVSGITESRLRIAKPAGEYVAAAEHGGLEYDDKEIKIEEVESDTDMNGDALGSKVYQLQGY